MCVTRIVKQTLDVKSIVIKFYLNLIQFVWNIMETVLWLARSVLNLSRCLFESPFVLLELRLLKGK